MQTLALRTRAHRAVTSVTPRKHPPGHWVTTGNPVSAYALFKRWSSQILALAAFINTQNLSADTTRKNINKHKWWWRKYQRVTKRDGSDQTSTSTKLSPALLGIGSLLRCLGTPLCHACTPAATHRSRWDANTAGYGYRQQTAWIWNLHPGSVAQ